MAKAKGKKDDSVQDNREAEKHHEQGSVASGSEAVAKDEKAAEVSAEKPVEEKESPKQDAKKVSSGKSVNFEDVPRKFHKFL